MDGQQYLVLILSSVTIYMKNVVSFNWINIGLNLYLEQKWRKVKKVFLTFIECDSNTVICAMILFHRQYRLYDPHIGNGVNKRKKEREREKNTFTFLRLYVVNRMFRLVFRHSAQARWFRNINNNLICTIMAKCSITYCFFFSFVPNGCVIWVLIEYCEWLSNNFQWYHELIRVNLAIYFRTSTWSAILRSGLEHAKVSKYIL